MDREQRIHELIADLEMIPLPQRTAGQCYELLALRLADVMAQLEEANALERFMAQKFERPVPQDARADGPWDFLCRQGPELLMRFGTTARTGSTEP